MKKRAIAWLVMLGILFSWNAPVQVRAAQTEPLVLQTRKAGSGEHRYYYDAAGRCVLEERICGGIKEKTEYAYNLNGSLAEECRTYDGKLRELTFYDAFGSMTENIDGYNTGNVTIWQGTPEYDEYGRLIRYTKRGPYNASRALMNSYEETTTRYEYSGEPETLFFGRYEQDGNAANGPEPIEWQILDVKGDQLLLISKYALTSRVFHGKNTTVTWKNSDLRGWLNKDFLDTAFNASEMYQISATLLENDAIDRLFLLSQQEVATYFPDKDSRVCEATAYAVSQNAYVNPKTGGSWWLLRTPATVSQCVMSIDSDGAIDYDGGRVASPRGTVRPSMWVSITAMRDNATPCRIHEHMNRIDGDPMNPTYTQSRLATYNQEGVLVYDQVESYDSIGIRTSEIYSYDETGNFNYSVVHTDYLDTDSNRVVNTFEESYTYENTYDKKGQLTEQVVYYNGQKETVIRYGYDWNGRMTSRKDDFTDETWQYDSYGNMLKYTYNGSVWEENTYVPLSRARWMQ